MNKHYRLTLLVLGAVFVGVAVTTLVSLSYANMARKRLDDSQRNLNTITKEVEGIEGRKAYLDRAMKPVGEFSQAWAPAVAVGASKDLSLSLPYALMDSGARKFGLTANAPHTPASKDCVYLGRSYRMQPVTISGSLNSLVGLCSWLGDVEQSYPYARIETVSLAAAPAGTNLTMTITMLQPVGGEETGKKPALASYPLYGFDPGPQVGWTSYMPKEAKGASPINLRPDWNPLLPSSPENSAITYLPTDETSSKIQNALDGRLQTVIRANTPAACGIMIDGRIYHVGDEVYDKVASTGGSRPKKIGYIPGCVVKLAAIRADSILFQVTVVPSDFKKAPTTVNAAYRLPPSFCVPTQDSK